MQKTESKAVRSEEANVTAQAVQPHVAAELLPELPVHSATAAPQTWGIWAVVLEEIIDLADKTGGVT